MDWNKDKSILLSKICVGIFAVLLLAADIGAYWLVRLFIGIRPAYEGRQTLFLILIYLLSLFAWTALLQLWKLLSRIQSGLIFCRENREFPGFQLMNLKKGRHLYIPFSNDHSEITRRCRR